MKRIEIEKKFNSIFQEAPFAIYRAPGRVNLSGEHVDYNGGRVLPFAIPLEIIGAISRRLDGRIHCFSTAFTEMIENTPQTFEQAALDHHWTIYVHGVINCLIRHGYHIPQGINLWYHSTLPTGAGLSSSAALEVLTIRLIFEMIGVTEDNITVAQLAHEAETIDVGVHCGIMDQFAIALCKDKHALLLDTETQDYQHIPLNLANAQFVLFDTMTRRSLLNSSYNQRRSECAMAQEIIKKETQSQIINLASLKKAQYEWALKKLPETLRKRVRHVTTEVKRTHDFVIAITQGEIKKAGQLMRESHRSLRDDYEVSCNELNSLASLCQKYGALGERMIGAGFGGCVLSLFLDNNLKENIQLITMEYQQQFHVTPRIYFIQPVSGCQKWEGQ